MKTPTSESLFSRAQTVIPGGVNSPVRAFKSVGGTPIFIKSAKGAYLFDEDGNRYIDYVGSWGPMLLGHAHPAIVEAVQKTAESSTSFGAPTRLEVEMAELLTSHAPNIDLIRMVNSGTEACMSAIRVARGFTRRDKIIKFKGCYHGHADSFLIQAGSGALTFGTPSSPGVPKGAAADTLVADFNNSDQVSALFQANPNEIAAVIVEPVAGNMGCIPPIPGFLESLRTLCTQHGAVLIFDEVMTGFRVDKIGAQSLYNIQPDLTCFGKIIGGGLPVGAYGGKREIMGVVSPVGPVYQAGTLSGNPLAMAAGFTLLKILFENPQIYMELDEKSAYLEAGIKKVFEEKEIPLVTNRVGSMLGFFLTETPVVDFTSACTTNQELFNKIFHGMLKRGVYLPASAFEAFFLSNALSYEDLDITIDAFKESLQ